MSDQLGISVLGSGYWGINYVRLFTELPAARVVSVCDLREERLQEVQRRFPDVTVTADLDEALHCPEVEAAVVCTNAAAHYDVAQRSLRAGKHVLIEKPMATTTARAQKLLALAQSKGLVLMVGHIFLYNAGIQTVKSYIERGDVGQVYYVYARRTNLGPIRSDVNALWDLASHDVSIIDHLLGQPPQWVSAVGTKVLRNCREDVGFIILGYPNGVLGHIHVSWAEPNKVREVVVVGSDRRIVFNDLDPVEQVRIFEKGIAPSANEPEPSSYGEYQFSIRDGAIISPKIEVSEPLKNQCNHFLDCVTKGCTPLSGGQNGVDVVRIMEAISRSMLGRGRPVELNWDKIQQVEKSYEYQTGIAGTFH